MIFTDTDLEESVPEGVTDVCPKCGARIYKLELCSDEAPVLLDKKRNLIYITTMNFSSGYNNLYEPRAFYKVHECGVK